MNIVYVCPERDIECGRSPKSWCETCPQWKNFGKDGDEEPLWAHKNIAAPSDLKIGDYVFASRWKDCDPGDPWRVGYIDAVGPNWVSLDGTGRRFPNAMKLTPEQAERIIAQYPGLEGTRGIPYKTIYEIFNPKPGCSKCGIVGLHACPGAVVTPMSQESKSELVAILAEYPPMTGAGLNAPTTPINAVVERSLQMAERERAFLAVRKSLADPIQDGVLAKIRRIVAETE
jgi:hypothetical protein